MPGDGLAFAVGVGCQIECVRLLERLDDGFDVFFIALDDLVLHREIMLRVDGAFLGHKIANMTVRGHDIEVLAKVLADRIRLCWRLHNDEIL